MLDKTSVFSVAMALVVGVAGCSGGPSNGVSSGASIWPFSLFAKRSESGFPVSVAPDYEKSYEEYRREYTERKIVAPALGLKPDPQPNALRRISRAVAESPVGQGVASVFKRTSAKVAEVVTPTPDKVRVPDAVSLETQTGPPGVKLHVALARLQERSGRLDAARQQYEKALKIAPDDLGALLGLARLHDRQGEFEKAIGQYQEAAQVHPDEARPLNDLGLCYARQGKLDESAATFLRAIELKPDRTLYRNNIATVLVELDRVDEALEHLAGVHGKVVAHYNVGYLLNKQGWTEAALEQFTLAVELDPSFEEAQRWINSLSTHTTDAEPISIPNAADAAPTVHTAPGTPQTDGEPSLDTTPNENSAVGVDSTLRYLKQRGPEAEAEWQKSRRDAGLILSHRLGRRGESSAPQVPPTPDQLPTYIPRGVLEGVPQLDLRPLPPVDPAHYPPSRY